MRTSSKAKLRTVMGSYDRSPAPQRGDRGRAATMAIAGQPRASTSRPSSLAHQVASEQARIARHRVAERARITGSHHRHRHTRRD